jgi:hypothetical protein
VLWFAEEVWNEPFHNQRATTSRLEAVEMVPNKRIADCCVVCVLVLYIIVRDVFMIS